MFVCESERCKGKISFSKPTAYIAHIEFFHPSLLHNGPVVCTHSECCRREFNKFNSFRKHVKKHRDLQSTVCTTVQPIDSNDVCISSKEESPSQTVNVETSFDTECMPIACKADSLKFDEALTIATVAHVSHLYLAGLTETQIQSTIDSSINMLNSVFISSFKGSVMSLLTRPEVSNSVSDVEINNVSRMFDSIMNMYDGFQTSYLRSREYEKCGAYVAPEEFVTGTALNQVSTEGRVIVEPVKLKGQFIPFHKVLKGFLELPGVLKSVFDYIDSLENSDKRGIENVIQGRLWKEKIKPMFPGKVVLPLSFMFDDYETGKELGFHTGVHSLGAGYVRLLCLPPQYASQLENIFLVLLFYSSDKEFGNRCVFAKVVEELQLLENRGILVVTNESTIQIFFALCFVGGDNKGANEILGFVRSFSANFYCRMCSSTKTQMCKSTKLDISKSRTPECYDKELRINNQTLTGRYGECVFNDLHCYHVYENFHTDIMHDWDEGIWKYVMTDIVRYLVRNKVCSLDYLNELIQSFYYGPNENRNKPPLILQDHLKPDHKLRFSASEMRCFVRYFGLIVGPIVTNCHQRVWNLYMLTRKIADIITAPRYFETEADDLSDLMHKHHSLYNRLFPQNLKPKFHIALHGPHVMASIGPLEPVSCIRVEAKHKQGSDVARKSNNRINLPCTVARRHQLMVAHRFLARQGLEPKFEYGRVTVISIFSVKNNIAFLDILPASQLNEDWHTVKFVKTNGMRYEYNSVVLISVNDDVPCFGRIHVISVKGRDVFFVLQCLQAVQFDEHLHAFEVEFSHQWKYANLNDLHTFVASDIRYVNSKRYIPFRFSVRHC